MKNKLDEMFQNDYLRLSRVLIRKFNLNTAVMLSEIYSEYIDIEFEGNSFKAIKNYDKYLSNLYGDYMKLPPVEKRISHHTFKAYFKN